MGFRWASRGGNGAGRGEDRQQPKQAQINEADPAVRAFVDQKVKERLDDMRRMAKSLDMLKAGEEQE